MCRPVNRQTRCRLQPAGCWLKPAAVSLGNRNAYVARARPCVPPHRFHREDALGRRLLAVASPRCDGNPCRLGTSGISRKPYWEGVDTVRMKLPITLALVLHLAGCTEKNPALCSADSPCADGLICRGNQCVAEDCTSAQDCEAGAPFCSASGLCAMTCVSDAECPGFAGSAMDTLCQGGVCVECRSDVDCSGDKPLCDITSGTCRGCLLDDDCASGACGPTGACLAESD